jgi:hypothetical protein
MALLAHPTNRKDGRLPMSAWEFAQSGLWFSVLASFLIAAQETSEQNGPSLVQLILNAGSIAGLISIFLEVHQSRRNRPSFNFTFEGSRAEIYAQGKLTMCDWHFSGLLRNASLNPNTIARLYLVVWKSGRANATLRFGHSVKEIVDLASNQKLALPLRVEGRGAVRAEVIFDIPLTGTGDDRLMREQKLVHTGQLQYYVPRHTYEFVFEDAAGNYFDKSGRLLSRELIDLDWTLPNHKGWSRTRHYARIAWAWVRWKLAIIRSWVGFYR